MGAVSDKKQQCSKPFSIKQEDSSVSHYFNAGASMIHRVQ